MELLDLYYKQSNEANDKLSARYYKLWLRDYLHPLSLLFYAKKPNLLKRLTNAHLKQYHQFCDYIIKIHSTVFRINKPSEKSYLTGLQQISSVIILLGMTLKQKMIDLNTAPQSQKTKSIIITFLNTSDNAIHKMSQTLLYHQSTYRADAPVLPLELGDELYMWQNLVRSTIQKRLIKLDTPISKDPLKESLL